MDSLSENQTKYLRWISNIGLGSSSFDVRQQIVGDSLRKNISYHIDGIPGFVGACFFIALSTILGLLINIYFTIGIVVVSLIVVHVQNHFIKKSQEYFEDGEENATRFLGFLRKTISNHEIIKIMLDERKIASTSVDKMRDRNESWFRSLLPFFRSSSIGTASFHITSFISISIGAILHYYDLISIGEVFVFFQITNNITASFSTIASFAVSRAEYIGVCSFVEKHLSKGKKYDFHDDMTGEIRLKRVSYRYPEKDYDAVSELTLSFSLGKIYYIQGTNGSGKSTLGKLISHVLIPDSGEVSTSGIRVLYFSSNNCFLPLSVSQNIIGSENSNSVDMLKKELDELGGELAKSISERLFEKMSIDGSPFSAGERQLIHFMRAMHIIFAQNERVFAVFDEITSSMDSDTRDRVLMKLQNELKPKKHGAIVISHDGSIRDVFDVQLVMDRGHIHERI